LNETQTLLIGGALFAIGTQSLIPVCKKATTLPCHGIFKINIYIFKKNRIFFWTIKNGTYILIRRELTQAQVVRRSSQIITKE